MPEKERYPPEWVIKEKRERNKEKQRKKRERDNQVTPEEAEKINQFEKLRNSANLSNNRKHIPRDEYWKKRRLNRLLEIKNEK